MPVGLGLPATLPNFPAVRCPTVLFVDIGAIAAADEVELTDVDNLTSELRLITGCALALAFANAESFIIVLLLAALVGLFKTGVELEVETGFTRRTVEPYKCLSLT